MGHCFFGKGRKLQYLIKWKGYPVTNNTWESREQVFAPRLIQGYHQKHPLSESFPHKKALLRLGRAIPSASSSCWISQGMPPTNLLPQLLLPCPLFTPFPPASPLKSTLKKYIPSTHP